MNAVGAIFAILIIWGLIAIGGAAFWNNPIAFVIFIVLTGILVLLVTDS